MSDARQRRLGDRAVDRVLRLPPPTTRYAVRRGVKIPMRDGVELVADHFAPLTDRAAPTILLRNPYGRGLVSSMLHGRLYAARGYHVIVQSVRGTFGSGGTFRPIVQEPDDGADTVAWLREQPWFDGRLATIGMSYSGAAQWALMRDPPPELAAAVIVVGPHDFYGWAWGTGAFALSDILSWSHLVAHQEEVTGWRRLLQLRRANRALEASYAGLPLGEAGRELLSAAAPWYESWVEHPDRDDPFWAPTCFDVALDKTEIPILLIGGWQDGFINQNVHQYRRLRERGVDVALTVGPWAHGQMLSRAGGVVSRETLQWLDTHVAGRPGTRAGVRIFVTGAKRWIDLPDWPPPTTEQVWYLQRGGGLAETSPQPTELTSEFEYKPWSPTPAIGGPTLSLAPGHRDDSALADRDDVLAFTSAPFPDEVYVAGNPVVELRHSSDNPHVDLFVRVSEVAANGRSRSVSDGYRRLAGTAGPSLVRVELDPVAHRFAAGSRIRVLVAGGAHPRFSRNPGTGEPPISARSLVAARHVVHHGERSRLLLPIWRIDGGTTS